MKQKKVEEEMEMNKKGWNSPFGYNFHSIIDRDYELIKRFKTATESLSDSQVV